MVERGHEHLGEARLFHAHIELSLPGGVVEANHERGDRPSHADAFVAVRDAFDAAKRRLSDWEHKHHGVSQATADAVHRRGVARDATRDPKPVSRRAAGAK